MPKPLSLRQILEHSRKAWQKLPDYRKPNNNLRYGIEEAALAAFSVFFMQSPSFLAHQRDMQRKNGRSNARTLFGLKKIPSDNQIRNLLDPISPDHWHADFEWVLDELKRTQHLESFRSYQNTWLVVFDGVTYHSSTKIHCAQCSQRRDSEGTIHYYHSVITPLLVKPDCPHVLPLPPEFIVPQDGHEKQDCERAAVKRWLAQHHERFTPQTVTYLGDDLHANQPLCQSIAETYQQFFVFVCKPDSHEALYRELALLARIGGVFTHQERHWNGRHGEIWTYRWAEQVPLRAGADALHVQWCELTIRHEQTGKRLFHNAWVTNHALSSQTVAPVVQVGRTRWKIENEEINVLKNHGYHLEHNFGHGQHHLSTVLLTLNLFAFLVHTAQHLVNAPYRTLREILVVRRTFFDDWRTLTRYLLFESWEALFTFMLENLTSGIPPPKEG